VVVPAGVVADDGDVAVVFGAVVVSAFGSSVAGVGVAAGAGPGGEVIDLDVAALFAAGLGAVLAAEQDGLAGGTGEQP